MLIKHAHPLDWRLSLRCQQAREMQRHSSTVKLALFTNSDNLRTLQARAAAVAYEQENPEPLIQ